MGYFFNFKVIFSIKIQTPHLSNADGGSLLTGVLCHVPTSYFRGIAFGRLGKSGNQKTLCGETEKTLLRLPGNRRNAR